MVRPQTQPLFPAGFDAPTTAREWDLPSHGALTLFFRWRKKSVQKKASGTATPLHTFLSPSKEKCERPMERQVPLLRRSRRVRPLDRKLLPAELSCNAACRGAFRSPPAPLRFACQSKTVPHRVAPVKLLYTVTSRGISTIKRMNKGTFRSPIKKRNARKTISPQYPRRTNRIIPSVAALKPHHAAENCGHTCPRTFSGIRR